MAQALDFHEVTLDAGDYSPDVTKGKTSEEEAPEQSQREGKNSGEYAVTPEFGDGEGGAARFPYPVKAVDAVWFSDDVLKIHLK